jgi:hypothetical protein
MICVSMVAALPARSIHTWGAVKVWKLLVRAYQIRCLVTPLRGEFVAQ